MKDIHRLIRKPIITEKSTLQRDESPHNAKFFITPAGLNAHFVRTDIVSNRIIKSYFSVSVITRTGEV